jgi:hypothetical protein
MYHQDRELPIERRLVAHLLDARQHPMDALVKCTGEYGVGHDHVETLEAGDARQEIPVRRVQAVGFERLIGNGQYDVSIRSAGRLLHQPRAQRVFIVAARDRTTFEVAKGGDQESGLPHEALSAPIEGRTWLEHTKGAPLEIVHAVLATLELVVQPEDLCDETRAQMKRGLGTLAPRGSTCHTKQYLSLRGSEERSRMTESLAEPHHQLARCDQIGQDDNLCRRAQGGVLDAADQQRCGRARRYDDEAIACFDGWPRSRQSDRSVAESLQIGNPD